MSPEVWRWLALLFAGGTLVGGVIGLCMGGSPWPTVIGAVGTCVLGEVWRRQLQRKWAAIDRAKHERWERWKGGE